VEDDPGPSGGGCRRQLQWCICLRKCMRLVAASTPEGKVGGRSRKCGKPLDPPTVAANLTAERQRV
jgi:hypothetical protein